MDFRPAIAAAIAAAILFGGMVEVVESPPKARAWVRGTFFLAILALFTLWVVSLLAAMLLDTMIARAASVIVAS
jgi:F0F1-type ATP synthase membrane subunit c/vacuolar-type H+-ATPase subunit K